MGTTLPVPFIMGRGIIRLYASRPCKKSNDLRHGVTLEVCGLIGELDVYGLTAQLWMTVFCIVADQCLAVWCHFRYLCRCWRLYNVTWTAQVLTQGLAFRSTHCMSSRKRPSQPIIYDQCKNLVLNQITLQRGYNMQLQTRRSAIADCTARRVWNVKRASFLLGVGAFSPNFTRTGSFPANMLIPFDR